jgi:hypothetical protein
VGTFDFTMYRIVLWHDAGMFPGLVWICVRCDDCKKAWHQAIVCSVVRDEGANGYRHAYSIAVLNEHESESKFLTQKKEFRTISDELDLRHVPSLVVNI